MIYALPFTSNPMCICHLLFEPHSFEDLKTEKATLAHAPSLITLFILTWPKASFISFTFNPHFGAQRKITEPNTQTFFGGMSWLIMYLFFVESKKNEDFASLLHNHYHILPTYKCCSMYSILLKSQSQFQTKGCILSDYPSSN